MSVFIRSIWVMKCSRRQIYLRHVFLPFANNNKSSRQTLTPSVYDINTVAIKHHNDSSYLRPKIQCFRKQINSQFESKVPRSAVLRLIQILRVGFHQLLLSSTSQGEWNPILVFGTGGLWGVGRGFSSVQGQSWWWGDTFLADTFRSKYRAMKSMFSGRTCKKIMSHFLFQSFTLVTYPLYFLQEYLELSIATVILSRILNGSHF